MGWFTSDTYVTQENHHHFGETEMKVIAGAIVMLVAGALVFLCLRAHNKFAAAKMRQTAQKEIRLNNVQTL